MEPSVLNRLKMQVERAVRPVHAAPRRKMQMRENLLRRIIGIFDEEKTASGDDSLALARTSQRVGDPVDLARDFQRSVPRWEALLFRALVSDLLCDDGDHVGRRALRRVCALGRVLLVMAMLALLLIVVCGFPVSPRTLGVMGALCLNWFVAGTLVIVLAHGMWHAFYGEAGPSWSRVFLLTIAAGIVGPLFEVGSELIKSQGAVRESLTSVIQHVPFLIVVVPYCLMFLIHVSQRTLEITSDPWPRRVLIDAAWLLTASIATFVLGIVMVGAPWQSFHNCLGILMFTAFLLAPADLVFSRMDIRARIRATREWEKLQIDG
jgi:hypothetical protein